MKTKRLLLSAILTMALAMPQSVSAYDYDFSAVASSGQTLYYSHNGSGVSVTYPEYYTSNGFYHYYWHDHEKPVGDLIIPSTVVNNGHTYTVNAIHDFAFYDCDGLTSISIPASIASIGNNAFDGCNV